MGQSLLQSKEDLLLYQKQERIYEALNFQIDETLVKTGIIDEATESRLKNLNIDTVTFRNYLLSTVQFLKSDDELLQDFKELKTKLTDELLRQNVSDVSTNIDIKGDKISVLKTYTIDAQYVLNHFEIEPDKVHDLMQVNGFVSKYAVLRLPKVFKTFIETCEDIPHFFSLSASKVFESDNPMGYSIDIVFDIKTSELEIEDNIQHIVSYIKEILDSCNEYVSQKLSID